MAIISFAMTVPEMLAGKKTATRRIWKESYTKNWQKWYDNGRLIHQAYDKSPRNGGKQIGWIKLAKRPFTDTIGNMTQDDLRAEGGMCKTVPEFCTLIGKPHEQKVTVLNFDFMVSNLGDRTCEHCEYRCIISNFYISYYGEWICDGCKRINRSNYFTVPNQIIDMVHLKDRYGNNNCYVYCFNCQEHTVQTIKLIREGYDSYSIQTHCPSPNCRDWTNQHSLAKKFSLKEVMSGR